MTKVFCDSCGHEKLCCKFEIPCHVAESIGRGYVDREGNAVSGRMVSFDLCNACSNMAYDAAFKAIGNGMFKAIKENAK